MRIKLTSAQAALFLEYAEGWPYSITVGKTYADIPDGYVSDVIGDMEDATAVKPSRVAETVVHKLKDARAAMVADACHVEAPDVHADGLETPPEGQDPTDPYALPQPVILALAGISRGEYGPEPARLAEGMDDRPNERITRWVARLRHKLISAGLTEAADAIRIVNPASV